MRRLFADPRFRGARDVGALTLSNGFSAALSLVQAIVVARILGARQYGVAALIMSFPNLLNGFFEAKSSVAGVRFLSEFHEQQRPRQALAMCKLGYTVDLGIASLVFVICAAAATWIERTIVHAPGTAAHIVVYSAAFIPQSLVPTSRAVLSVRRRFRAQAIVEAVTSVARVATVLVLVIRGWGPFGIVTGVIVAGVLRSLLIGGTAYVEAHRAWNGSWLRAAYGDLAGWGRRVFNFLFLTDLTSLVALASESLDTVLLGALRGPTEVGWYHLAKRVTTVAYVASPLQSVAYPRLSQLIDQRVLPDFEQALRRFRNIGLLLAGAGLSGLALMPWIVPGVGGPTFRPAIFTARVLLVGALANLALFWLRPAFLALHRVGAWTAWMAVFNIALAVNYPWVIYLWGHRGLAVLVATANVTVLLAAAAWLRGRRVPEHGSQRE